MIGKFRLKINPKVQDSAVPLKLITYKPKYVGIRTVGFYFLLSSTLPIQEILRLEVDKVILMVEFAYSAN
jgi:hypothetical protein